MTKNPFYNAVLALAYIVILISFLFNMQNIVGGPQSSILFPMAGLSLFVFSAALMGYLFLFNPLLMIIDGDRKKGIKLFLQTLGVFACGMGIIFIISLIVNSA